MHYTFSMHFLCSDSVCVYQFKSHFGPCYDRILFRPRVGTKPNWCFGYRGRASDSDMAVSMVLHSVGLETYLFSLSRDGNLRMWSCSRAQFVMGTDMMSNIAETGRNLTQGGKFSI
jgi:hypothetical protein